MLGFESRVLINESKYTWQMEKGVSSKKDSRGSGTEEKTSTVVNNSIAVPLADQLLADQLQGSPKQIAAQKHPFPSDSEIAADHEFFVELILKNNPNYTRKMAEDEAKSHH